MDHKKALLNAFKKGENYATTICNSDEIARTRMAFNILTEIIPSIGIETGLNIGQLRYAVAGVLVALDEFHRVYSEMSDEEILQLMK